MTQAQSGDRRIKEIELGMMLSRIANSDTSGTFTFTNLPPGLVSIQPTLSDLFTPTNVVLNPLSYAAPTFNANGPVLGVSRSTNGIKITIRSLPSRFVAIQTNINGAGAWNTLPPSRVPDSNGNAEFFHTNILSGRTLLFRARR